MKKRFFSHDENALNDPKIMSMMSVYGFEGYGMFWALVEMLRREDTYKINMTKKSFFNSIAHYLRLDIDKAKEFLIDCIDEFELFASDGEFFWSESLNSRMQIMEQKTEARSNAANARWSKNKVEQRQETTSQQEVSKDTITNKKRATSGNATVAHYSSDVEYLTDLLVNKIKANNSNAKIPAKLDAWKKDINAMIELDNYRFEQVARIIEFCQSDDFWKSNILSAKKLREKAGTLILQMQRTKPKEKKSESPQEMFDRLSRLMEERDNNEQKRNDSAIDVDAVFL